MSEDLSALDRELSELLAVEPSPAFAASVRARIEQQPARTFAGRWWLGGAIAAAATIAIAVAAAGRRPPAVQLAVPVHTDVRLSPPVHSEPPVASTPTPRRLPPHALNRIAEPDTLFDPSLAAAVRRLTTEQPVLPQMPAEPSLTPMVVEPLTVRDIADTSNKQGDRQ